MDLELEEAKISCCGDQDHYDTLSYKTMALWKVVEEQYDAQYVLKVDDDNYVRLDRLAIALDQWTDMGAGQQHHISPTRII